MLERKIRKPFNFFIRFVGISIAAAFLFYAAIALIQFVIHFDELLLNIPLIDNFYFSTIISLVIGIIIGVFLLWFSVKQTFIYNALRNSDVNRVLLYYIFVIIVLLIRFIVSMVSEPNLEITVFNAKLLQIPVSFFVAIEIAEEVLAYIISIYFFRKFLIQGAENSGYINANNYHEQSL